MGVKLSGVQAPRVHGPALGWRQHFPEAATLSAGILTLLRESRQHSGYRWFHRRLIAPVQVSPRRLWHAR